jgi:hypothetical protein
LSQNASRFRPRPKNGPAEKARSKDTVTPRNQHSTRRANHAEAWFTCIHCCQPVVPASGEAGCGTTQRNHCPVCLWSRHVDDETPGDRASECQGAMEPVAVWARPGGDWAIIHRCRACGELRSNRIAGDDNELALVALAVRALAQPPFPLHRLNGTGAAAPPASDARA